MINIFARFQLAFLLCLYLYMGLAKIPQNISANYNDLLMHFLGYVVLMCSGFFAFPDRKYATKLFICFFIYSFLIECLQYFLPYRSFSLLDLVANGSGLLVGIGLSLLLLPIFNYLHRIKIG